jgi:hypothetical protein
MLRQDELLTVCRQNNVDVHDVYREVTWSIASDRLSIIVKADTCSVTELLFEWAREPTSRATVTGATCASGLLSKPSEP